ncbi:MAG: Rrf2 family transcriptional regulator [Acidobacteria bacterium]|nr:Rrf2 family transcriptional regulator [Acidobacteriota bacterium]
MLKLTKKADYGLIAMRHLTTARPRSSSAKEMADRYGLPAPVLAKILQSLARGGFLVSEHGSNGGYRLSRPPEEITAFDIVRTIDGPIFLTSCFTENGDCEHHKKCSIRDPLRRIHEGIIALLTTMTMADLATDADTSNVAATSGRRSVPALTVLNRQ